MNEGWGQGSVWTLDSKQMIEIIMEITAFIRVKTKALIKDYYRTKSMEFFLLFLLAWI